MPLKSNTFLRRAEREDLDTVVEWMEDEDFLKVMERIGESTEPKYGDDFLKVWENDFEGYSEVVQKMGLVQ